MNKLLAISGIGTVLMGLALLIVPVGHVPLLDANRQILVETEAGGYCAGEVWSQTQGWGDIEAMEECIELSTLSSEINLRAVQGAFCRGLVSRGFPITVDECLAIMGAQKYWLTEEGTLTNTWNSRFPYPLSDFGSPTQQTGDESRTGERDLNEREGNVREGE